MTTDKKTVKKKTRSSVKKAGSSVKKKKVTKKKSSPEKSTVQKKSTKPKKTRKDSKKTLILNAVLVINNARPLSQEFSQLIKTNEDISIDASAVEMIDTAILQLLLATTISIRTSKHKVNWINPSEKFIASASLLGLSELLGIT
ncbi:MAG: hypothetical protein BMS9Abin19_0994 [Gammaproteobacteria bacterium]|nr:MAG: hypothetical protein BMS9Abin19_0994 [Gammaproteobacteria bacterium]